jgi:hypothetical protein
MVEMDRKLRNELKKEVLAASRQIKAVCRKPEISNLDLMVLARCGMALENWLERLNSG